MSTFLSLHDVRTHIIVALDCFVIFTFRVAKLVANIIQKPLVVPCHFPLSINGQAVCHLHISKVLYPAEVRDRIKLYFGEIFLYGNLYYKFILLKLIIKFFSIFILKNKINFKIILNYIFY